MKSQAQIFAVLFAVLLLTQGTGAKQKQCNCDCDNNPKDDTAKKIAYGAAGGMALLYAVPLTVAALGFGPFGIAAGSIASGLMSTTATTGVGGAIVATLQSVGAAGLGIAGKVAVAGVGSAAAAYNAGSDDNCNCC